MAAPLTFSFCCSSYPWKWGRALWPMGLKQPHMWSSGETWGPHVAFVLVQWDRKLLTTWWGRKVGHRVGLYCTWHHSCVQGAAWFVMSAQQGYRSHQGLKWCPCRVVMMKGGPWCTGGLCNVVVGREVSHDVLGTFWCFGGELTQCSMQSTQHTAWRIWSSQCFTRRACSPSHLIFDNPAVDYTYVFSFILVRCCAVITARYLQCPFSNWTSFFLFPCFGLLSFLPDVAHE